MSVQAYSNTFFSDKSFQKNSTNSYTLVVLIEASFIAFTVFHSYKNKYIGIGLYENDKKTGFESTLNTIIQDHSWLKSDFKSVNIVLSNGVSTLIPNDIFLKNHKESYLSFNLSVPGLSVVKFDLLKHTTATNVYAESEILVNTFYSIWPSAKLIHSSTILIDSLLINFKNLLNHRLVYVHVHQNRFEMVRFKDGKLNFYNSFRYKTKEDFIYFILATLEQLQLNPEDTELVLSGGIKKGDAQYEIAYKYIRNISLITQNETFDYSNIFDDINYPEFYLLLNALQCV